MKTRLFWGNLLVALMLTACQPETSQPDASASDSLAVDTTFMQKDFYKQMKGQTQDGMPITLHLFHRGNAMTGTWTNDLQGIPERFVHNTDSTGEDRFFPFLSGPGDPAIFKGRFTNSMTLEGTWSDLTSGKTSPIRLLESKDGVAGLATEYRRQENCKLRERILQNPPKGEIYWADTLCSFIGLDLLHAQTGSAEVDAAIEGEMMHWVCKRDGKAFNDYGAFLNSINDLKEGYSALEHDLSVVTNEADVLSLSDWTILNEGGAHPYSEDLHINIDLKTGKVIELADILKPDGMPKLTEIGGSIFRGDDGSGEWIPDTPPFKLPANFAITKAGLLFQFAAYEIAPYAAGLPQVMIPYTEIEDLLLPGGVVARLRGK